jgi:Xaa-Pro aminopeptidase
MSGTPTLETPLTEAEQMRRELLAEKHAQAVSLLNEHDIDCWLTFAREGSDVLLPFLIGGDEIVGMSALMIFASGVSVAVVADYDQGQVDGVFSSVIPYSNEWREPMRSVLRERAPGKIAVNYSEDDHGIDGLTHGLFLALKGILAPIGLDDSLVSSAPISSRVRALKTRSEIERMRRACAITQRIFDDVTGMLKPGLSEADVFDIVKERMTTYEVGPAWDETYCPTVSTSRTRAGHNPPGANKIEPGDTVRIDLGVVYEGYCSDMQRTWYIRKPGETGISDEVTHAYDTVRDGILMAAASIKPGIKGYEVDEPVRGFVEERGYKFTHALGHQLGRLCHDGGMVIGPRNERYGSRSVGTIEAGMVFTLEPCTAMIALENDVVVTADGCEFIDQPPASPYLI